MISSGIRRLLQVDRQVHLLTSTEAEVARDRDLPWNFFFNACDVTFFMGSVSLLAASTILPLFISKLTDSTIPVALVAMLSQGGFFLPQLFTANYIERMDRKKPVIVNLGFLTERVPAMLLVLAPLLAYRSLTGALILFLLLYAWFNLGGGVVATAWQDLIARCFPVTSRGRFLGGTMFLGTLLGVGATTIAGGVLETVPFPLNFAYIFGTAGAGIFFSWFFLAQTREPIEASLVPRRSNREYLAELPAIVASDKNFRNFLVARFTLALAEMGTGFLTIAAIQVWSIADSLVAVFTTATLIGQTTGSLLGGFLADRFGHRLSLELATCAGIMAFGLAWFAPGPTWFVGVFFLIGFFAGTRMVSSMLLVMEFCPPPKRPTYVGLTNTLIGIGSIVAPLIGALLVNIGYSWVFAISMMAAIAALIMLRFWVKEPRFANQ